MLELCGQGPVAGHRSPAVLQDLHAPVAQVDHGFDGEEHARTQFLTGAIVAVVQDVRGVMEHLSQAVTAEVAHDCAALALRIFLDGRADVADAGAWLDHADAAHHRFVGDVDQTLRLQLGLASIEHAAGVAVPAIDDDGDVDIDDVAVLQHPLPRNAMTDDMVDRSADRLREAAIVQRCGDGPVVGDVFMADAVQLSGGHARFHVGRDQVQGLGGQPARLPHALERLRPMQLDLSGVLARRLLGCDIIHGLRPPLGAGAGLSQSISTGRTALGYMASGVITQACATASTPASRARRKAVA